MKISRRNILLGGLSLGGLSASASALSKCVLPTAPQTEGPFYPQDDGRDNDWDLTRREGRSLANGEVVEISGQVTDTECTPLKGVLVEIWQADHNGQYDHERDPNREHEMDSNFQYWGEQYTDENGIYRFRTIIPGAYPAAGDWWRPPHIHFKVAKRGYHELTTQMYFAGHELNERDRILMNLSVAEREGVVVPFTRHEGCDHQKGEFNIVLKEV